VKHIGEVTSAERSSLVTMTAAIRAIGNIILSFFVLPLKKFLEHFIANGQNGKFLATNESRWMTRDNF
jgi:hypothetical protein